MGTIADAFTFIYYVCNDIDPILQTPKQYAYYYSSINNNNVRWGEQEYYSPLYGGNYYMYDCSSLIGAALIYAGILDPSIKDYFWTGNMAEVLQNVGFKLFDPALNTLQPGDILLNHNTQSQHTEMLSNYDNATNTWYAMGAHNSHLRPISEQISSRPTNISSWQYALRLDPQESAFTIWTNYQFYGKYFGGFDKTDEEAYVNACMIASVLMSNINYSNGQLVDYPANLNVWSKQAVCALLGNIDVESGYNPARFEGDHLMPDGDYWAAVYAAQGYSDLLLSFTDYNLTTGGYGFVQFTPSYKYIGLNTYSETSNSYAYIDADDQYYAGGGGFFDDTRNWITKYPYYEPALYNNWSLNPNPFNPSERIIVNFTDAIAQLLFLSNESCPKEWDDTIVLSTGNTMTFDEFRTNLTEHYFDRNTDYDTLDPLTEAFMRCYEKPANLSTLYQRQLAARYWWDKLDNMVAITPPNTEFRESKKSMWLKCFVPQITIKL